MATYKVWLTVKDCYGNTKEVEGGSIDVDLNLTEEDADRLGQMALDNYVKKADAGVTDAAELATDEEVKEVVSDAVKNAEHKTLKYVGFSDPE